jgi:prepilin-type N-terminal cleavage/methylation domain-containing protein
VIKNKKAMTLIEVVVAMGLFGVVMVTIFPAALVLTLMNRVSYENIDTTFIAQQAMERIIFESSQSDLATTHQMIQNEMLYTFLAGQSNASLYRYERVESRYTIRLDLAQRSGTTNLWQILIVVDSSLVDAEGTRTQLETIVVFE